MVERPAVCHLALERRTPLPVLLEAGVASPMVRCCGVCLVGRRIVVERKPAFEARDFAAVAVDVAVAPPLCEPLGHGVTPPSGGVVAMEDLSPLDGLFQLLLHGGEHSPGSHELGFDLFPAHACAACEQVFGHHTQLLNLAEPITL